MKYRAEIFDRVQELFRVTGYNDHQLHCVIQFTGKVEAPVMKKATEVLVKTVPILSRVYRNKGGKSFWEDNGSFKVAELLTVVDSENDFNSFTYSKTDEASGPQIKICLLQAERDAISIVMNHMVTDADGFKQVLYLLSDIYSKLLKSPDYLPDYTIDGDRSITDINRKVRFADKVKVLLCNTKDNNRSGAVRFPMSAGEQSAPFILTHDVSPEIYGALIDFCKRSGVTVNDVMLTVYYRALASFMQLYGVKFSVSIMIDMRRYLDDSSFTALTNLSSIVIIHTEIRQEETFEQSLAKISAEISAKKTNFLGLNTFLKLDTLFKIAGQKRAYLLLRKSLYNPYIGMTNIGILDSSRLAFEKSPILNAHMCGSIKYRPHFQMAVSSFKEQMTLSVNLYGSGEDIERIRSFFNFIDDEIRINIVKNY